MKAYAKSDIGKAREMNQDYFYISSDNDKYKIYIVADGMGGYKGGEIASSLASISVKSYIESNIDKIELNKEKIMELIKNSILYANTVVYNKSKEDSDLEGMGTTIEVCLIYNNRAYIGHVGDSRIYRIRKNIIRRLTRDHSYVEDLVRDGTITREEAYNHPKKNMITRALGCYSNVEPDVMVRGFLPDDIIVMTSDGLTNMIKDDEIYNIVKNNVETAHEKLIERANELGGYDNITVIILDNTNL